MTQDDRASQEAIATYRAEMRAIGRPHRLGGFALILLGAVAVWLSPQAGGAAQVVAYAGYGALAAGWALMVVAIFLRTRYHRRRMRELN